MRTVLTIAMLLAAVTAFAQQPPNPQAPEVQQIESQMAAVGCNAERTVASQTIVNLQKQLKEAQDQLKKVDPPPKGGATKK
jgi:hypothetical protein